MALGIEPVTDVEAAKGLWRGMRSKPWNDPQGNYVGKELELVMFRGASVYFLFDGTVPVSINATYFGQKKKNAWEPYANFLLAYTRLSHRRRGHAKELARHVLELAKTHGCRRLKSLAGTRLGARLHQSLGHQFWGVNKRMEAVVDSPLIDRTAFPEGVPASVRQHGLVAPLPWKNLGPILNGRRLRYEHEPGPRGVSLEPPGFAPLPCRVGSKQSILVDLLSRPEGATMEQLIDGLSGGTPWKEITVRSGFGWDLKHKGYGVESRFTPTDQPEEDVETFHLVIPPGYAVPPHSGR